MLSVIVSLFAITGINAMTKAYSDSLSVTVYYPCGSSSVSKIPDNMPLLNGFVNQLDSLCKSPLVTPVSLFVTSSTSPEGSLKINKALTRKRTQAVMDYLKQHSESFRTISNSLDSKLNGKTTNHQLGKIRRTAFPSLRYSKVTLLLNIDKDTIAVVEQPSQDIGNQRHGDSQLSLIFRKEQPALRPAEIRQRIGGDTCCEKLDGRGNSCISMVEEHVKSQDGADALCGSDT